MRESYPSDISREQFEKIRPILESSRKKTRPRELDLYEVFCGRPKKRLPVEQKSFQSGKTCITIFKYGIKRIEKSQACWLKKISWREQWSETVSV